MSKSFDQAFQEWSQDHSYEILDDIGEEFYDAFECPGPTPVDRSLTVENGKQNPAQKVLS